MNKLTKQILILLAFVAIFVSIDLCIYNFFIKKVISHHTPGMQKMSVEVNDYVPFTDDANIVKIDSDTKLEGDIPVIDGAAALLPVYAGFVNSIYPEESVKYDGTGYTSDSKMQYTNTRSAFENIVNGKADIIICASPSESQLQYAEENGVELVEVPIGSDAFVFIVNSSNPVSNITMDQIRGIYSGRIRNWKELGGRNELISAMKRNEGSGSQTALQKIMGDEKIAVDYDAFMGKPIGFSFRYYVTGMLEEGGVKMLSIDGVEPNVENIENGTYPIASNFYAIYRKGETNENVYKLIEWILSEEGQKIVKDSGYVPVG